MGCVGGGVHPAITDSVLPSAQVCKAPPLCCADCEDRSRPMKRHERSLSQAHDARFCQGSLRRSLARKMEKNRSGPFGYFPRQGVC